MVIDNKFGLGEGVYLRTDPDQYLRIVTGITVRNGGYVSYELSFGVETSWHIESEISKKKSYVQ